MKNKARTIQMLSVNEIKPMLDRDSTMESFEALKDSIDRHNVIMPITVTSSMSKKSRKQQQRYGGKMWAYEAVRGHRRLRASFELGKKKVPAFVVPIDNVDKVKEFFIENEVRNELTPYELAVLMDMERGTLTITELSIKYSISPLTIRKYLSVLEQATEELAGYLRTGRISMKNAHPIAKLTHREQRTMLKEIMVKELEGDAIGRFVISVRRSTTDNVTKQSINAQTRAVIKLLNDKEAEYQEVLRGYVNSVVPLEDMIKDPKIRKALDKAKVDYSHFYIG
jgi:ParB/RepB/Spo0J family partition protein